MKKTIVISAIMASALFANPVADATQKVATDEAVKVVTAEATKAVTAEVNATEANATSVTDKIMNAAKGAIDAAKAAL